MKTEKLYPNTPLADLDHARLSTYPLESREGKVTTEEFCKPGGKGSSLADFIANLPDILAARDLKMVAAAIVDARANGKGVLLGMGAHPVKVGLGPLIADSIASGVITGVATNGATIIHDYELSVTGKTSEDVDAVLGSGQFGMAEETAVRINTAIAEGAANGDGIGRSLGRLVENSGAPHVDSSILAACYRHEIPATVHIAMGTDIIHMHPSCDGAAAGKASLSDFHLMTSQVAALDDGVFINLGSAVIIPEVFLKAYSLARNLGYKVENLTTVNMDFIQQYRPRVNVVQRPTVSSGKGYSLTGHHEIMFPLLMAAVKEQTG